MSTPHPEFDRREIRFRSVSERTNKFRIEEIAVDPDAPPPEPPEATAAPIRAAARRIRAARERGAPVMLCHGAHLIKNGLAPVLIRMVEEGWLTHVATNGAGSIHDWEFGFLGESCEDVRRYVTVGEFGIWEETGAYHGLALLVGALDGLGYGQSIGRLAADEALRLPDRAELLDRVRPVLDGGKTASGREAAAMDLLAAMDTCGIDAGERKIPHPWKRFSIQSCCHERGVPLTVHPGVGQDIVYSHPLFRGGAVGRTALTDFLIYAQNVRNLCGGVYLSVGSSVMSPMIFEKSLSMSRNVAGQTNETLEDFSIVVNDLAEILWDWSEGEPRLDNPAYYVRFMKSFSRMGGSLSYVGVDNRIFLQNLYRELRE